MSRLANSAMAKTAARSNFLHTFAISLIVLLGPMIRGIFAKGLVFDQSVQIAKSAWDLYSSKLTGTQSPLTLLGQTKNILLGLRQLPDDYRPVSLVLGLIYNLFGVSDLSSIILPMSASILICILLYLLGRLWFEPTVGLMAAFLWAILPIDIFLSTNLLPTLPIVAGNILAVYFFLLADKTKTRWLYFLSLGVVFLGLFVDWTFFLSTLIFLFIYFLSREDENHFGRLGRLSLIAAVALLLFPQMGAEAVDLYYLISYIFENLLILPLLLISLVYASTSKMSKVLRALLLWLGLKAILIVLAAYWIIQKPLVATIGMSGYWLELLVPVLILISWQFVRRIGSTPTMIIVLAMSVIAFLGLLVFVPAESKIPDALFTVSRISVGVTFFAIALYLIFWNIEKNKRWMIFSLIVIFFLLATPTIANDYVESYRYTVEDADKVLMLLSSFNGDINLFVGDDAIYDRFLYLNDFQTTSILNKSTRLSLEVFNQNRPGRAPTGSYVLLSERNLKFALGSIPSNWSLIEEFGHSDQQKLFLYIVGR